MRVLKYLRGHIPAVALIVLLLAAQSFCELSLPAYTSRIVDTGIQSGGIEYAAPLALTDKTMDGVRLFLSDDDAATVSAAYTYDNGVWTLGDTARLPELEGIFIRPLGSTLARLMWLTPRCCSESSSSAACCGV